MGVFHVNTPTGKYAIQCSMPAFRDITGQRFGQLIAINLSHRDKFKRAMWNFRCDCGTEKVIAMADVAAELTISCGCFHREELGARRRTHGRGRTKLYKVWTAMKQRCLNPKDRKFKDYGGRGITVCDRWLHSFEAFLEDMGECPPGLSLDRRDNDGPYDPDNCRWTTLIEQSRNMRRRGRLPKHLRPPPV
jgi:hypothetical protein